MKKFFQIISTTIIFFCFLIILSWSYQGIMRMKDYNGYLSPKDLKFSIIIIVIFLVADILYGVYLFFALKLFNTKIETNKLEKILFRTNPIVPALISIIIVFIFFIAIAALLFAMPGPEPNIIGA
jgi:hypothetical protein